MKEQNYKNHKRLIPLYHFVTFTVIFLLFIYSIYITFNSFIYNTDLMPGLILIAISFSLLSLFFYARIFANKAQDRAIRAEENLRHFALTGKLLDPKLSISQVIALRFAPDNEFVDLSKRAVDENFKSDDIKKAVKNWKPDIHRA